MKFLQGNLHRSKVMDGLLVKTHQDTKAELMFISEQYKDRDIPGWYSDILGIAAIWIPHMGRVSVGSHDPCRGFFWVRSGGGYLCELLLHLKQGYTGISRKN